MSDQTTDCAENFFDLELVQDKFKAALVGDEDVDLGYYLDGFRELLKFCDLMGSLFSFVSSEISGKIQILEEFRSGSDKEHFTTLSTMTDHETSTKLLNKDKYVSGSRTLLRLHWGLDFIRTFLKKLGTLNPGDATSSIGREAYAETLAAHHGFFIRQGAYLAMYTLPTQSTLIETVCKHRADSALSGLPAMLEVTNQVFDRVQAHYTKKSLLDLS